LVITLLLWNTKDNMKPLKRPINIWRKLVH
jgi:hypothetical protein